MAEEKEPRRHDDKHYTFKLTPTIGLMTNVITIIGSIVAVWVSITSHIENITIQQTKTVVRMMDNDISNRLNLYTSYVNDLKQKNEPVPPLLNFNILSLKEQLNDLKEWNNENSD